MNNRCDKFKPILQYYADNQLAAESMEEVKSHLAQCGDCRREVFEIQKLGELFRAGKEKIEEEIPPALVVNTWKAVEESAKNRSIFDFLFTRRGFAWSLATYAAGVLIVVAGYLAAPMDKIPAHAAKQSKPRICRVPTRENVQLVQFGEY